MGFQGLIIKSEWIQQPKVSRFGLWLACRMLVLPHREFAIGSADDIQTCILNWNASMRMQTNWIWYNHIFKNEKTVLIPGLLKACAPAQRAIKGTNISKQERTKTASAYEGDQWAHTLILWVIISSPRTAQSVSEIGMFHAALRRAQPFILLLIMDSRTTSSLTPVLLS